MSPLPTPASNSGVSLSLDSTTGIFARSCARRRAPQLSPAPQGRQCCTSCRTHRGLRQLKYSASSVLLSFFCLSGTSSVCRELLLSVGSFEIFFCLSGASSSVCRELLLFVWWIGGGQRQHTHPSTAKSCGRQVQILCGEKCFMKWFTDRCAAAQIVYAKETNLLIEHCTNRKTL